MSPQQRKELHRRVAVAERSAARRVRRKFERMEPERIRVMRRAINKWRRGIDRARDRALRPIAAEMNKALEAVFFDDSLVALQAVKKFEAFARKVGR